MTIMYDTQAVSGLRRAASRAILAPSIHNTQPWRFVVTPYGLEVYADWSRRLRTIDPRGRQLLISCGCAIFNARVSLAAQGFAVRTEHFPEPDTPDLLARISVIGRTSERSPIADLDSVIELRHTNRRRFEARSVPDADIAAMVGAAEHEGSELYVIDSPEERVVVAALTRIADEVENGDASYRAELRTWTTADPHRRDGVPVRSIPHVTGRSGDEVPMRDFDTRGVGWLPPETESRMDQCLLLLGTSGNDPWSWLRAGEGLQRVLLELTRRGLVASPFTQMIEVRRTNEELRQLLNLDMFPHLLLRVGYAEPTPAVRRRLLVDVLEDFAE